MRPTWESYFVNILNVVASRSSCLSRKCGAILIKENRIIATGYNGAPSAMPSCYCLGKCLREDSPAGKDLDQCYAIHAEVNAIIQCSLLGISCKGSWILSTNYPCSWCARIIAQAGITKVGYLRKYPSELSRDIFKRCRIDVKCMKEFDLQKQDKGSA